jgi:DnaK suppressor protein
VSKTPAKKTSPKKAATKVTKTAVKPAVKATAKPTAAAKTPAKPPAVKTSANAGASKAKPQPAAKARTPAAADKPTPHQAKAHAAKTSLKPPAKDAKNNAPVTSKSQPTPKPAPAKAAASRAPSPAPQASEPAAAATPPTPRTRASSKAVVPPPAQAPLPLPTSRFADRFAPPRPPTRQMNNLGLDTPKHTQITDPKLANAWKSKSGKDLTEAELLAMPDGEYMNEKQLEFFRVRLQALKDDLLSNAGETTEHLREDTSIVPDPADRATIEEEHALELRTRDRERKLLKKISQSLNRIDAGDYGFCDETGEPIGLGRLVARPTATLSLEAQQRRELKQKMFGD